MQLPVWKTLVLETFGCRLAGVLSSCVAGVTEGFGLIEDGQNRRQLLFSWSNSQDAMPRACVSWKDLHASVTEFLQFRLLTSIADGFAVVLANVGVPLSGRLCW